MSMSAAVLSLSSSPLLSRNLNIKKPIFRPKSLSSLQTLSSTKSFFPLSQNNKHVQFARLNSFSNQNQQTHFFKSLKTPFSSFDPSQITPFKVCKWSLIIALALSLAKRTIATLTSPFFWTYFSFTWVFWPYLVALAIAILGFYSFNKHSKGESTIFHQLAIVTGTITWLTIVPPAHFNGFLEGWPIVLFFIYHYFFFFESSVRKRMYGDLYPRDHDPKWDINLPKQFKIAFFALILAAHFLAAYEGPEIHLISGGWANFGTWVLVLVTIFMRYHSVLYLAKYSEKVVVPMEVVQFGPYRFVRHPIYASTMLLFALHCITLRAPLSLAFVLAVCVWYYGRKADLEEKIMVDTFGERYKEYAAKVRYRLIPFLY